MENIKRVIITPDLAREFLKKNTVNRPLSQSWASELRNRMVRGEWLYNGESIKFDNSGDLIDGQHRLAAVIMANITIETLVETGLPNEVFSTLDENRRRSGSDILAIQNEKNTAILAALARMVYFYDKTGKVAKTQGGTFSNSMVLDTIDTYPGLRESASFASSYRRKFKSLIPSCAAFCHYIFNKISPEDTETFFDLLSSGAGLEEKSPILKLRDMLIYQSSVKGRRYSSEYWCHLVFKTWNLYREGKQVKRLLISKDVKFPKPK